MNDYFAEIGAWPHGSHLARAYVIGFLLSLLATIAAYALVVQHALSGEMLFGAIFVLAFAQLLVQLVCFLHLGASGTRMRTVALLVALAIVSILVIGSLWIMSTLNNRMMPSQDQMTQYMQDQTGL
ncbi:MAG TPA: cytochrome C oxidase subunit IV family protein [Candidatus Paceibacterota bacterium]|nr:cytochrome C oxidase subunit IV family protein [Candidatus Paceibacterota bacterium]